MALINKLSAIADAIRNKTGISTKLTLDEMATAINNMSSPGGSASDDRTGIKFIYSNTDTFLNTYDFTTQRGRLSSIPFGEYPPGIYKINASIVPIFTMDFEKISKEIIEV